MSQAVQEFKNLLSKMATEGLTLENARASLRFLEELNKEIQEGKAEYGQSNVSTAESRCYDNAVIAKSDLLKVLKKKLAEFQSINALFDDITLA